MNALRSKKKTFIIVNEGGYSFVDYEKYGLRAI